MGSTWVKLDDTFPTHPKVLEVGPHAAWVYVAGLCYCSRHLTDGFIPAGALWTLTTVKNRDVLVRGLIGAGLWDETNGGWQVHDYAEHQRTKAEVEVIRGRAIRRASIHRNPALKAAIRERDGDRCRYCGRQVDWTNRRGPLGATYDHVEPEGPDTLDNLVVCCRGCNSTKGSRTPLGARMPLRSVLNTEQISDSIRDLPETEDRQQTTDTDPPYPPDDLPPADYTANTEAARAIRDALRRNPLSLVGEG